MLHLSFFFPPFRPRCLPILTKGFFSDRQAQFSFIFPFFSSLSRGQLVPDCFPLPPTFNACMPRNGYDSSGVLCQASLSPIFPPPSSGTIWAPTYLPSFIFSGIWRSSPLIKAIDSLSFFFQSPPVPPPTPQAYSLLSFTGHDASILGNRTDGETFLPHLLLPSIGGDLSSLPPQLPPNILLFSPAQGQQLFQLAGGGDEGRDINYPIKKPPPPSCSPTCLVFLTYDGGLGAYPQGKDLCFFPILFLSLSPSAASPRRISSSLPLPLQYYNVGINYVLPRTRKKHNSLVFPYSRREQFPVCNLSFRFSGR